MLKLKGLTWNFDLDIKLQIIIEMHPNWMPQKLKYKYQTSKL
jgi:hypothetical protein